MQIEIIALLSALLYAVCNVIIRLALGRRGSPFNAVFVFLSGASLVWLAVLVSGYALPSAAASALFAVRGLIDPGIAAFLAFVAFRRLGASLTIPIIAAASLVSTALSAVFLNEVLTLSIAAGTILIIAGVWLLAFRRDSIGADMKYVLVAIAASALIGAGTFATKLALNVSDAAIGGLAVSLSAGLLLQALVITLAGKWGSLAVDFKKAGLFVLAGMFVAAAFVTTYVALSGGAVNVIGPLFSTQPLFALVLSAILLRKYEKITGSIVLGTVTVVAGAAILTLA